MNALVAIARKELRLLFASRLAWTVLALVTAYLAWSFLNAIQLYVDNEARLNEQAYAAGVTDLVIAPLLATAATMFLWVVPLLTMRCIVEERRGHTLPLLFAAGASDTAIVLGKYMGVLAFLTVLWLVVFVMSASLALGSNIDWGKMVVGAFGLWCLLASLTAIGLLSSAYAQHPASAALGALAITLIAWIVDTSARQQGVTGGLINYLAIPTHLTAALRGVVASVDLFYFVLIVFVTLALATRRVSRLRVLA